MLKRSRIFLGGKSHPTSEVDIRDTYISSVVTKTGALSIVGHE